jgi:hypothetical protein
MNGRTYVSVCVCIYIHIYIYIYTSVKINMHSLCQFLWSLGVSRAIFYMGWEGFAVPCYWGAVLSAHVYFPNLMSFMFD